MSAVSSDSSASAFNTLMNSTMNSTVTDDERMSDSGGIVFAIAELTFVLAQVWWQLQNPILL